MKPTIELIQQVIRHEFKTGRVAPTFVYEYQEACRQWLAGVPIERITEAILFDMCSESDVSH